MRVCYFGVYDNQYSRNKVIIKGLKANGVEVAECASRAPGALNKFFDLIKKHRATGRYDAMIVGFPGQQAMILAKLLSRGPIIFDAFTSQYDSVVHDRQAVGKFHPKAWYLWLSDWLACALADRILLDTEAHIDYFVKEFKIAREKFICVRVGADIVVQEVSPLARGLTSSPGAPRPFLVHFHGSGIPLQGYEHVIAAARSLANENIKFRVISTNINKYFQGERPANVEFLDNVGYDQLAAYIQEADVCLGIFGDTDKAGRVIPNKVYEALALGKPVITADTPAIRELFTDREHLLLCRAANPRDLADKILELRGDRELRVRIAQGGHRFFLEHLTPERVVRGLVQTASSNFIEF